VCIKTRITLSEMNFKIHTWWFNHKHRVLETPCVCWGWLLQFVKKYII
jgi:hypothetical protein